MTRPRWRRGATRRIIRVVVPSSRMDVRASRLAFLASSALGLLIACAPIDTGTVARRTAAELLECDDEHVELRAVGAYRYQGQGCGRRVNVACTAGALEPLCIDERELTSAGGESAVEPEPSEGVEANIRAGLDGRREDILACVARDRVAVRVAYAPDGSVEVRLQGELEGTPEERCVQQALEGVRVAPGAAGTVVHLVR